MIVDIKGKSGFKLASIDKSKWKKYKFSDLFININEKIIPKESGLEHYIGLEHLDSGYLHIKRFGDPQSLIGNKLKIYKNDIILAKRNAYLKRAAIADFDAVASAHSLILRRKPQHANTDFIPFFLMSEVFWKRAIDVSVGSLSPTINWKTIAKQEFLLPPKDQQAQLTKLLWAMDDVIEGYWKTKNALEKYKMRIAYDCYYSEEVQKVNLEDLTIKIQDGSHFSPKIIYPVNDGTRYRYVTSKNIRVTGIEFKEDQYVDKAFHDSIFPRCDVQEGDILLTKDGANTGTATLNSIKKEFSLLSSVCLIRSNDKTTNDYLCQYFNSEIGNTNLVNQMTGTAITRLTLTTLRKIKVPIPTLKKQREVVNELNSIDSATNSAIESINEAKILQKSLINLLF